jgi:hypothetical protein
MSNFNFWDQNKAALSSRNAMNGGYMSMAALLAPVPPTLSASTTNPVRFGMLPQGTCARCFDSICGGVNAQTGRPLPERACGPNDRFNCYYPSEAACNQNQAQRQALAASLSTSPFRDVMQTVYNQPNYADAAETFFAGKN